MTANRPYAAWLRSLAGLVALAGVFVLSACGGGSGAPNNPFATTPVTAALTVLPASPTIYSQVATTLTISGGTPPYRAFSSNTGILPVTQAVPGNTVTLLAATVNTSTAVLITIQDAAGVTVQAQVTILPGPASPPPPLTVLPSPVDVFSGLATQLTISGGVPPYRAFSSNTAVLPVAQAVSGSTVNLLATTVSVDTTVIITIQDSVAQTVTVNVTVRAKGAGPALVVLPSSVVTSKGVPITLTISGGLPPFKAYSSNPAVVPVNQSVTGNSLVFTANNVAVDTSLVITIQDSAGQTVNVSVQVLAEPSSPPPTLAVLPDTLVIFSGVATSVLVTGGVPPYIAVSSNPAVLPVTQAVAGNAVPLLAANVSADTPVTLTIQDTAGKTATAAITVRPAPLLNSLTIKPNLTDCGTQAICSGQNGTATVNVQLPGGGAAPGRQIRFDVVFVPGPYTIAANVTGQPSQSVTVTSDAAGSAQVIIRANVDAPTQLTQIRATDIASGQQLTGEFLIQQRTDGSTILTVVPSEATITTAFVNECSFGFKVDYFIYGGTPPYRVTQGFPDATLLVNNIVNASGGFFEVLTSGFCTNPQTFSIKDANGLLTSAKLFNLAGTAVRPPGAPPELQVTPNHFGTAGAPVDCTSAQFGKTFRFVISGGTAPYNVFLINNTNPIKDPSPLTQQSLTAQTISAQGLFFDISFKAGNDPTTSAIGQGATFTFQVIDAEEQASQQSKFVTITCNAFP